MDELKKQEQIAAEAAGVELVTQDPSHRRDPWISISVDWAGREPPGADQEARTGFPRAGEGRPSIDLRDAVKREIEAMLPEVMERVQAVARARARDCAAAQLAEIRMRYPDVAGDADTHERDEVRNG